MDARPGGTGLNQDRVGAAPTAGSGPIQASSGLADIDAELARLAHLPVGEHVEVFAGIHRRLVAALAVSEGQTDTAADVQTGEGAPHHGAQDNGRPRSR